MTVTVDTVSDSIVELDEIFDVDLAVLSTERNVTAVNGFATIEDNDQATITVEDAVGYEVDTDLEFVFTLNESVELPPGTKIRAYLDLTNDTAQGVDYLVPAGQLEVGFTGTAGETDSLVLPLVDDGETELPETVVLTITEIDAVNSTS